MARPLAYRHDLRCPHCGSSWMPRDGRSRGKQTYRCGEYKYRHTPDGVQHHYSESVKDRVLAMYAECSSISTISRVMDVKLATVFIWVKKSPVVQSGTGDRS